MKIRTAIPWLSLLLMVIAALNPIGVDFLRGAFSNEQLSRNIAQPIVIVAFGGLAVLALAEWLVRLVLIRRARRQA